MSKTSEDNPLPTATNGREPAETRVILKNGQTLSKFLQHPKGVLQNPIADKEMWSKFDDCVSCIGDADRVAKIRNELESFEEIADIREFTILLTT